MRQLERKIIKGVYFFETRQTLLQLIIRLLAIISFSLGGILLGVIIVQELRQQQTLDIFEIFFEDLIIIRENIGEVITTFFLEAPVVEIVLVIFALIATSFLVLKFIQNFSRVKNKVNSIIKFWFAD